MKSIPKSATSPYEIFNRVDWTWLSEDTSLLSHGWTPENGFLPYRWDYYSELMMMYLLGLGSLRILCRVDAWDAWKRTTFDYEGLRYIGSFAPLFVHQYSQAWFDFRGKRDKYADYFQNSVIATEVHRPFLSWNWVNNFPITATTCGESRRRIRSSGYVVWGGPPELGPIDGTVVPVRQRRLTALPSRATLRVLRNIRAPYGTAAWSKYGFVNAFNPLKGWYDHDVIGIDTGITLLMAENLRTGFRLGNFHEEPGGHSAAWNAPDSTSIPRLSSRKRLPGHENVQR